MRVPLAVSGTVRNIPEEAAIAWRGVVGHRVYELMHVGQDVTFHVIHELDLEEIDLDHLPSTESYQQKVPGHTHPGHSNPNPNPNPSSFFLPTPAPFARSGELGCETGQSPRGAYRAGPDQPAAAG